MFAIALTLSVSFFHTPLTPGTFACPPSWPSVPTSRATRVTSSAKADSWSTIVLTVSFSSWSSPVASTVTLRVRSPLATAVVTSAMSRTWEVSRAAITFTEAVTSRHRPVMPRAGACPPSRPSVPTSRANWVTSQVNWSSSSTMPLTDLAMRSSSPRIGLPRTRSSTRWLRSPAATASTTWLIPVARSVSLSMIALASSTALAQVPRIAPWGRRPRSFPSRPISRRTRFSPAASSVPFSRISSRIAAASATAPSPGTCSSDLAFPSRTAMSALRSGSRSASL